MRKHYFPYRRQFEYDRHTLFTYELINKVNSLTSKEQVVNTTTLLNNMDEFINEAKTILMSDLQNDAIRLKKRGMTI